MKIVANHYVVKDADPYYNLVPNAGSDKIWVWMAQDFAEGELVVEQFALKFGTPEKAQGFKEAFEKAKQINADAMAGALRSPKSQKEGSESPKASSPKSDKATSKPSSPKAAPQVSQPE